MPDSQARQVGPWIVVDPEFKREWVLPQALQYYVVEDRRTGKWFICDRWTDAFVPDTKSATRPEAIRRFYEWCKREMPAGIIINRAPAGVAHRGETG